MFNLKKIYSILQHLQMISPGMYHDLGKEIQIHCPFCDDAQRANASNHGHMYFSIDAPVFNCFRCSTSGTLLKFLITTDFKDQEAIKYVASFLHHSFSKDHFRIKDKQIQNDQLKKEITNKIFKFKDNFPEHYEIFKNYLFERLGEINFAPFLIYPEFIDSLFTCHFNNSENQLATSRVIKQTGKFRYQNNGDHMYFFQRQNFDKISRIVLAEGPFDIINTYLYNRTFCDAFFSAICGNSYISAIEKLIISNLLIGNYEINIIFDNDIKNEKSVLLKSKQIAQIYNEDIMVRGFKPLPIVKDVGEFPTVQEVNIGKY